MPRKKYKKYLKDLKQKWKGHVNIKGDHEDYLSGLKGILVKKEDKKNWRKLYRLIKSDPNVQVMEDLSGGSNSSLDAIMIISAQDKSDTPAVDPARVPKRGDGKQAINHKYRTNRVDMTKDTFQEAIENKKYKKDECWINALFDVYGEKLLNPSKSKRYAITRDMILQVIGKTEENIKEGLV